MFNGFSSSYTKAPPDDEPHFGAPEERAALVRADWNRLLMQSLRTTLKFRFTRSAAPNRVIIGVLNTRKPSIQKEKLSLRNMSILKRRGDGWILPDESTSMRRTAGTAFATAFRSWRCRFLMAWSREGDLTFSPLARGALMVVLYLELILR